MTPLTDLIARVEGLEGPDREVDVAIWAALQGVTILRFEARGGSESLAYDGDLRRPDWIGQPKVTASLDMALSVVERVLPGWCWQVRFTAPGYEAWLNRRREGELFNALHRTSAALALLSALLKALAAKDPS